MARPKSKHPRVKVNITLDSRIYKAARFDIDNLSAYFEVCLKKHILTILNSPDKIKFLQEVGDDIVYIMRSCKADKLLPHPSAADEQKFKTICDIAETKWTDDDSY